MTKARETYRIEPATADRWDDVVTVMGVRGEPARCWCQFFHLRNADWNDTDVADRRSALQAQVCDAERPPGVLAYAGGEVAGWCQVGPKPGYARMATARIASPGKGESDPPGLWSITCLVVPVGWRRQGIASALLDGAVEHARRHGASILEGYPVDTAGKRRSAGDLYHGTVSMFADAGFTEVRRPTPTRAVMRLALH